MVRRTACTCRPSSACSTDVRCRRKGPHHRIVGRPARSHRGWGFATRRRNGAAGPPGGRQPRPTPSCAGPRAIRIRNGRRRQSSCTGGPSASHSCPRTRGTYRRCGGGDKPRISTPVCTAPRQCRSFQGRASDTCEYPLRTMRDATMPYDGLYACVRHPRPVPLGYEHALYPAPRVLRALQDGPEPKPSAARSGRGSASSWAIPAAMDELRLVSLGRCSQLGEGAKRSNRWLAQLQLASCPR